MSNYQKHSPIIRATQGDIYRDISVPYSAVPVQAENDENDEELEIKEIDYLYAVVLSQECDLERDHNNRENAEGKQDKFLPSILFVPAYLSEQLRYGKHLEGIGLTMEHINSANWKIVKQNKNLRYHFLDKDVNRGIPDLAIDFKHYFTITRELFFHQFFNEKNYVASLEPLFREHLSNRFGHYLSRIGLPDIEEHGEEAVE